jgi:phage tail sheath gpL-like
MANINASSLAAATANSFDNVALTVSAQDVERKILIIGSYDPAKTLVNPDAPLQVFNSDEVGSIFGFGSMVHRLAIKTFRGGPSIKTFISPQAEAGGAAAAAGEIDFTVTTAVAGTLYLYIAGDQVQVNIAAAATEEEIADAVVAAVNADQDMPVIASKVAVTFEVTLTAKTQGTYGNDISIAFSLNADEELPGGVTAVITDMAAGTGTPTIQTALDALGIGDGANEDFYTSIVHGYLQDTTTLDAISTYVGEGNAAVGLWSDLVGRPFVALTGDTVLGSAALATLIALGDGRLEDRANVIVAVPDSYTHPSEAAALALGEIETIASQSAALAYRETVLPGVWPGAKGTNRWTSTYAARDSAVKAGISPTNVEKGAVTLQNVVTFYHPAAVPQANNGYRDVPNIFKLQNIGFNLRQYFSGNGWPGSIIVEDVTKANSLTRPFAKDATAVISAIVSLAQEFEAKGWIFSAQPTIDSLKKAGAVAIRAGGQGFDVIADWQLSGNTYITNVKNQFDINISA